MDRGYRRAGVATTTEKITQATENLAYRRCLCISSFMDQITKKAVKAAGGAMSVARATGISRQAVEQWPHVPAKHVLCVEAVSGISRYELRPDVYGPPPTNDRSRSAA
jgi:DNA-binding transcriptional regulator YdaS (Cro superfamily)